MADAPATTRYHPAQLVTAAIVTAGWMAALSVAVLSFGYGGAAGLLQGAQLPARGPEAPLLAEFSLREGTAALLISLVIVAGVQLVPAGAAQRLIPKLPIGFSAGILAVALGVVLGLASVLRFAWWIWIAALLLSLLTRAVLALHPDGLHKPWRLAGISASAMLFLTWAFQIFGGSGMGTVAVVVLTIVAAVLLVAAGVLSIVVFRTEDPTGLPQTGTHTSVRREGIRAAEDIRLPWPCHVLFALLGALIALAQPMTWSLQVGQAGFAFIIVLVLLGWAVGFELGPTFAPGMSRPRVTAFALLGAGILTTAGGFVLELTASAIFAATAAVLIGIGVRAQPYGFSRRIGFSVGLAVALLLVLLLPGGTIALSEYVAWAVTPVDSALLIVGLIATLAGVVAVLRFDPRGTTGLGVDIMYAFQPRTPARRSGEGVTGVREHTYPRGAFIVFEGGDGVGKSTQAAKLATFLVDRCGLRVEVTREPGGTEVGRQIRSVLLDGDDVAPRSEALLYAADRAHHVARLVEPALDRGEVVISDRYIDSSLAYQARGRELSVEAVRDISRWATDGLVPHLTVLLDLEPDAARGRLAARGEADRIEREEGDFHARVRSAFLELAGAQPGRYLIVDASQHEDAIAATVRDAVVQVLRQNGVLPQSGAPASLVPPAAQGPDESQGRESSSAAGAVPMPQDAAPSQGEAPGQDREPSGASAGPQRQRWEPPSATRPVPPPQGAVPPSQGAEPAGAAPHGTPLGQQPDRSPGDGATSSAGTPGGADDATTVLPDAGDGASAAAASTQDRDHTGGAGDAATTVLPGSPRPGSARDRARLLAQAKREREARDRLRRAREERGE
ncbi:dTMP kinase [Sediminivirga luteola]|uniref:Thymidylate kinase n=1 Tax=Sediminivirga luteola TaxID=1774748 RepID=A0A8J2XJH1_9MICO|nr:dTMP kinase [Sediminivirga luteola]GGA01676.1 hypothetical protein GCM10011333_00150 [Sediminivirga luteola]